MSGAKALAIEAFCKKNKRQFIRFDYRGHGESSGTFEDFRIGKGKEDILAILDKLCDAPQILVGSSMGGWIMLLAAIARPEKVAGLIGLAAAPDFTEHLLLDAFTQSQRKELHEKGRVLVPNCYGSEPYPIGIDFIAESGEHLVLDAEIPITCPVHLVHGMMDDDVPWEFSVTLNEKLASKEVKTTLVENGDHRLSSEKHLGIITRTIAKMLDKFEN
jgi:pimeloyl-ACP methyl ester carboxylesterase